MANPYSWQRPPRPHTLVYPDGSAFRASPDRTWFRALWAVEVSMASLGISLPGWADIFPSAQLDNSSKVPITLSVVREGLRLLRFEHPVISCRVACQPVVPGSPMPVGVPVLVYEAPESETDIETWLSEAVTDRSDMLEVAKGDLTDAVALVRRDLGHAMPAYRPAQFEVYCIISPDGSSGGLVLRCSHATFDGVGAFEFMNALVSKIGVVLERGVSTQKLQPLPWSEEVERLVGPVIDYARIPWTKEGNEMESTMQRKLVDRLTRYAQTDVLSLYTPHPNASPTYTGVASRSIPAGVVAAIIETARHQECTFFSTIYAAGVLAAIHANPPTDASNLTASQWATPCNLRYRDVLTRDSMIPSALGCFVLDAGDLSRFSRERSSSLTEDLWTLARDINTQMSEQSTEIASVALWGDKMHFGSLPPLLLAALYQKDSSRIVNPGIMSLGVIDKYLASRHGGVSVSQPSLTVRGCYAAPPVGPVATIHTFTWQGELTINLSYPECVVGGEVVETGEGKGSLLAWFEELVGLLHNAAASLTT